MAMSVMGTRPQSGESHLNNTTNYSIRPAIRWKTLVLYALMIGSAVPLFLMIRACGESLVAPPAPSTGASGPAAVTQSSETLVHLLLALVAVILLARAVGAIFKPLNQPPVMGEILAGIMIGPSLLGRVAPAAYDYILPASVVPQLGVISQVGVLLYMFLVGLELDTGQLRKGTHVTVAISHASIISPFLLGSVLALWLYPILSNRAVT